jgi:hypothetical protein
LVRAIDQRATYINGLTALTPNCAKIPIHFDTDREAIELVLRSLAVSDIKKIRVVRIQDTLSLVDLEVSESLLLEVKSHPSLSPVSEPSEMSFGPDGNLR